MVSRFQWILTLNNAAFNYAEIERVFPIINSIYLTEYCQDVCKLNILCRLRWGESPYLVVVEHTVKQVSFNFLRSSVFFELPIIK